MTIARKLVNLAALAVAAAIILIFALPTYRQGEASIAGKPAPLSALRGKVVVLNFWGSWCQPCVEEAPALDRLQKHIASRNAMVLGVAADEDDVAYRKFLQDQHITFPTYRDPATKDN